MFFEISLTQMFSRLVIDPKGVDKFGAVLTSPELFNNFLQDPDQALAFLQGLLNSGAIATKFAIVALATPLKDADWHYKRNVHPAIWELSQDGYVLTIINLLKQLGPEEQALILSAPQAIQGLASQGCGTWVVQFIEKFKIDDQFTALSATNALVALIKNGQSNAVKDLVNKFDPEQQDVLSNILGCAIKDLTDRAGFRQQDIVLDILHSSCCAKIDYIVKQMLAARQSSEIAPPVLAL